MSLTRATAAPFLLILLTLLPLRAGAQSARGGVVSRVEVRGLEDMEEDVVLRRMDLRVGSSYSEEAARRDERAITGLGVFWSVRIRPEPAADGSDGIRVIVEVEERFPWFALPEVAWTPEEGWTYGVTGGHLNLMRRGHRLFLSARTGGARYLSLSLSNPWNGLEHQSFHVGGAVVQSQNRLYRFRETGDRINAQTGRWFGSRQYGRLSVGVRYRRVKSDAVGVTESGLDTDRLLGTWLSVGWVTADPWTYPPIGSALLLRVEGYGGILGGDVDGGQARLEMTHTLPLGGMWALAGRLLAAGQLGDRPFWQLLNLGGPYSVRAHPLGDYLVERSWLATAELQWFVVPMEVQRWGPLGDQIVGLSLVCFADAGGGDGVRRGPDTGPWDRRTSLLTSAGGGLRLHNALFGTLRFEGAWDETGTWRMFFALGDVF